MTHRPGDLIIDRYLPEASSEEREEARRRLYVFVAALVRIASRLEREAEAEGLRDQDGRLTMET